MITQRGSNLHFRLLIIGQLETFKEYAEYIENSLKNKMQEFEEDIKGINEKDIDEYIDFYYDDISQIRDEFPAIMRNSLFTSIYSYLEDKVVELCLPSESGLKLNDLKGQGIHQAALYIKKVLKRDFPDQSKEWHFIRNANLVRNCIVHNAGAISKSSKSEKVINAIKELEHVSMNHHKEIMLDEYFCIEFIKVVEQFLRELYRVSE